MNDHGPQKQPSSVGKINAESKQVAQALADAGEPLQCESCGGDVDNTDCNPQYQQQSQG